VEPGLNGAEQEQGTVRGGGESGFSKSIAGRLAAPKHPPDNRLMWIKVAGAIVQQAQCIVEQVRMIGCASSARVYAPHSCRGSASSPESDDE
jgi:hypothetical protein